MSFRNQLHRDLEELLHREASKRSTRLLGDWILAERLAMFEAVNARRALGGKPPVSITEIERVEQQAVGHSDYGHKFALYCAELVEA
jgi:hypothetical protein